MKTIRLKLEDWDYECSDGCCTDYGTYLEMNGERLEHPNPKIRDNSYIGLYVQDSLEAVLKKLGYKVEWYG